MQGALASMGAMESELRLNPHEARVLGVLIEKELTTPDQYPLSLNATVLGCNQKSNRDPRTDYTEPEVVVALQGLAAKHLSGRSMPAGSRVERHRHNALPTLGVTLVEAAVLAELFMRGPQQPGELRTRVSRMSPIESQEQLASLLDGLAAKGYVRNLGRRSGERAERWGQTLAPGEPADAERAHEAVQALAPATPSASTPTPPSPPAAAGGVEARMAALEERVAAIEKTLADLGA